jgi:hypothetical protein
MKSFQSTEVMDRDLSLQRRQVISFPPKMIGKLNYIYVYPSCYCIPQTNSRHFIFLDIPDHNGLTISPSEREFLDFSGLIKCLNAKHSMDHGGVLLKPPVALPTLDLHLHDNKFVKPAMQAFSFEKDGVYVLQEMDYDSSRKVCKKIRTFRELSSRISADSGCNPEMNGNFRPKMLLNFRNAVKEQTFPNYVNNANVSYFPSDTKNDWLVPHFQ